MKHPSYWQSQFPDFSGLPPQVAAMRHCGQLVDVSYGNDACPSFVTPEGHKIIAATGDTARVLVLWVHDAAKEKRHHPEWAQFWVKHGGLASVALHMGDDEAAALAVLANPRPVLVAAVAREFDRILRATIGAEKYRTVLVRNRLETDALVCHSHDYCDANEVMAEAIKNLAGYETVPNLDTDAALWNEAWDFWVKRTKEGGAL